MKRFVFEIHGDPLPWARAGKNGKKHFTPTEQKNYANDVRQSAWAVQVRPISGAVCMEIVAIFRTPDSWSAAKRRAMIGDWAEANPSDVDNLAKLIMDALQAGRRQRRGRFLVDGVPPVGYQNDKQVTDLTVKAIYGLHPRTIVTIRPALKADLPDVALHERELMAGAA